jgi:hypothetical protein
MNAILMKIEGALLPVVLHYLENLLEKLGALTPEQQADIVAKINAKVGGPKQVEATSLAIIVTVAKEIVQFEHL